MELVSRLRKSSYWKVFFIALVVATVIFLPFLIVGRGIFIYYGDYNVQQIPFYQLAHEAIRGGNIGWNWTTDLGANFIGSYSFYLLGNPFFWLTIPFPNWMLPYLMAPLMILKLSCCAVTGYAFVRRFTKTDAFAMIGGLLYAFCGFNIYNIFFNHFLEVAVFFPLLLIALEEFVINGRRGVFALAVCLCAVVNYYFFAGQVVFVILYFIVRCFSPDFTITLRKFLLLALEAILGFLGSMFLFLPSALALMGNYRLDEYLSGFNLLLYDRVQRYGLIFESFFFPPDNPANPNFFPNSESKWASVSVYLPLISMAGVITYFRSKKAKWLKVLISICVFMAFVPILNSSFQLFKSMYYARWFYMLTLIMILATVQALEDRKENLTFGIKITGAVMLALSLIGILPSKNKEGALEFFSMPAYPVRFWIYVAIGLGGLLVVYLLYRLYRKDERYPKYLITSICVASVVYSVVILAVGRVNYDEGNRIIDQAINGKEKITLARDEYYRMDVYGGMQNLGMYWRMPTIQAFQSVVPPSIIEFYHSLGMDRGVKSDPAITYLAMRNLLSVKYLFVNPTSDELNLPYYEYVDSENGFDVYENTNYVPMGFTYEYYVTPLDFESYNEENRDRLMMKAIALSDEQVDEYGSLLEPLTVDKMPLLSEEELKTDAEDRRKESCSEFAVDSSGFTAEITLNRDNLVFFSVPFEKGWSATVNGEPAEVEQVNVGFMAVKADAGENVIRFTYETPGLKWGLVISFVSFSLLAGYLITVRFYRKKHPEARPRRYLHTYSSFEGIEELKASRAYIENTMEKTNRSEE